MIPKRVVVKPPFAVSISNLLFEIEKNVLKVTNKKTQQMVTKVTAEDMEILAAFAARASEIVSPLPSSEVIYQINNGPQEITVLKDVRNVYTLIIDDQVQFTTDSEEIYHEALVHPAIGAFTDPEDRPATPQTFLILGGGDGLVAKQIFKYNPIAKVVLVDFDPSITNMFTHDPRLTVFNENSMSSCVVINDDAFEFVKSNTDRYDVIICDFPDPSEKIFNKLYSKEFYENVSNLLNKNGVLAVQSGSLVAQSKSYTCIHKTVEASGFKTLKFYTPTHYGDLCYCIAKKDHAPLVILAATMKYKTLSQKFFDSAMTCFRPGLLTEDEVEVNTVENMAAYNYRLLEIGLPPKAGDE
jgi:spermidine synthase